MCSPHLLAPWDNSRLVRAVIVEGGGSFAVQGGEVAWGTCTGTLPYAIPDRGLVLDPDPTPIPSPWRRARRALSLQFPGSGVPHTAAQGLAMLPVAL